MGACTLPVCLQQSEQHVLEYFTFRQRRGEGFVLVFSSKCLSVFVSIQFSFIYLVFTTTVTSVVLERKGELRETGQKANYGRESQGNN